MSKFYFLTSLPTDILIEILLKLPLKSLIRCMSVCKSWQSLITSPTFIYSHLSLSTIENLTTPTFISSTTDILTTRYSLLKLTENGIVCFSKMDFPFESKFKHYGIVGTCHGLVCLSDDDRRIDRLPHVIIWNPYIKTHVVTPKPIFNLREPHRFVLGFGVSNHVYKVVRLVYYINFPSFPPMAEVFSLRTGKWRRVDAFHVKLQVTGFMCRQVFFNGIVHWLACEKTVDNTYRNSILTFEVGDEVFGQVMLPHEFAGVSLSRLNLFVIGESLGAVMADHTQCHVWIMNEYDVKESWIELYTINFIYQLDKVVGFVTCGKALFILQEDELVVYIQETGQISKLGIYGSQWSFYIGSYVESLLLLGGYGAAENSCSKDVSKDIVELPTNLVARWILRIKKLMNK